MPILSLRHSLARLAPALALTHLAGLSRGTESPSSAALALRSLLALRRSGSPPLQRLPLALTVAIGGGAGLGAAFQSRPCWGPPTKLEETQRRCLASNCWCPPCLLRASAPCSIPSWDQPAALAEGMALSPPPPAGACPAAVACAHQWAAADRCAAGRLLVPFAQRLGSLLRPSGAAAAGPSVCLFASWLAVAVGGISLNDGFARLSASPGRPCDMPLVGRCAAAAWAVAEYRDSALRGGLKCKRFMSLGAVLVGPWAASSGRCGSNRRPCRHRCSRIVQLGAARTPLFCSGILCFTLAGQIPHPALAAHRFGHRGAIGAWLGRHQLERTQNHQSVQGFRRFPPPPRCNATKGGRW